MEAVIRLIIVPASLWWLWIWQKYRSSCSTLRGVCIGVCVCVIFEQFLFHTLHLWEDEEVEFEFNSGCLVVRWLLLALIVLMCVWWLQFEVVNRWILTAHTHTLRQTHTLWTVDAWGGKAPTATMVPYHTFIFNLTHPQTAVTCVYALKTSTLCVCLIFYPSSVWLSMLCSQKQTVFCKRANSSQLTASHFRSFYATSHKKKSVSLFESIFYMEMDFIVCL